MIPAAQQRTLISSGVEDQASFGISHGDQAHIMRILRDQLYSDKVLAVLREYSSNAWDANRMAGRGDLPIEVNLPTLLQPYLSIKDRGPGLSRDDVFKVYTQYGASTKRDSNIAVGMLGIGSKSAFSYTSSFTITSWHGGTKSVYNASLDERDVGVIQLLHEEPCAAVDSGVEIKVPVKNDDLHEFTNKAKVLFPYFQPLPKFNISLDITRPSVMPYKNGFIETADGYRYNSDAVGVLGCIPYRISSTEIENAKRQVPLLRSCYGNGIGLFFEIGEVDFSASREELKYSDRTRTAIIKRLQALAEEVKADASGVWDQTGLTQWEKRIKLEKFSRCGISTDVIYKHLNIVRNPELKGESFTKYVAVQPSDKFMLVIRDDWRALGGFDVPHSVSGNGRRQDWPGLLLADKTKNKTNADVQAELAKFVIDSKLEGMPIRMLSSFTWTKPQPKSPRGVNMKHAEKAFVFKKGATSGDRESENWEIQSFVPSDDDVFVILDRFVPDNLSNYVSVFNRDQELATLAGLPFPSIRGYKTTQSKPMTEATCKGTLYTKWQVKFYAEVMKSPAILQMMEDNAWAQYISDNFSSWNAEVNLQRAVDLYQKAGLAADHQVVVFLSKACDIAKGCAANKRKQTAADRLIKEFQPAGFVSEVSLLKTKLAALYPLFGTSRCDWTMSSSHDENFAHRAEYIVLKDLAR